jgi:hypothetical protein
MGELKLEQILWTRYSALFFGCKILSFSKLLMGQFFGRPIPCTG